MNVQLHGRGIATRREVIVATAFVSGLRRTEGFELPVIEGLFCGCRPVVFNSANYRQWFDGFAEFIEEGPRGEVLGQLVALFAQPLRPVTPEALERARARFNWETIVRGFLDRLQ